jgi:kynureninase
MNEAGTVNSLMLKAQQLDAKDPLRRFRAEFHIPRDENGREEIYLVGNSLGLQPRQTETYVLAELENWRNRGVRGHVEGELPWLPYHEFLTEPMADLVGALPIEVVMMNSLTINLHLMLATFYRPTATRGAILLEQHAFPSDHYAIESQIQWHGLDPKKEMLVLGPRSGCDLIDTEQICRAIQQHRDRLALVLLPGVQYYTGQFFDIRAITAEAHRQEVVAGFDLAHAAGNVPLTLHDWGVDFAVWCSYKYLNSGPGSVGGCFVHERHVADTHLRRLSGWWGHDKATRFEMNNEFLAIPTAEGWQVSNPPILSMAAIRSALEIFSRAGGIAPLRAKSELLTGLLIDFLDDELADQVRLVSPRDFTQRGSQLSLRIIRPGLDGKRIHRQLEQTSVRTDWREPDVIRVTPVPLYNTFADVAHFASRLKAILQGQ